MLKLFRIILAAVLVASALAAIGLAVGLAVGIVTGCDAMPDLPEMYQGEWDPLYLEAVQALTENTVGLRFSRPVESVRLSLDPSVEIGGIHWENGMLQLTAAEPLRPGSEYWLDAIVRDDSGNTASVLVTFFGLNPDLPRVLINEIVCRGSGNNPDFAELRVFEDGNLGGMTLYNGSPGRWTTRKVFPEMWVEEGDYIIVHFRPENIPEEVDELTDKTLSGGLRSHPEAWDLWVWEGGGLPTTSGGLTLTEYPDGPIMDALLYSERSYDSTSPRRGFGTAAHLEIFEDVVARGGWKIAGEFVVPDDGVNPSDSTATRSINRDRNATDTDTREDWHIVPTRGATPGTANSEERYEP